MSLNHSLAWQELYTATASPPVLATVSGVYDVVPEGADSPYIQIGQLQSLRGRLLNESERIWYVDIHIWSAYQGRKEVLEIADAVTSSIPNDWYTEELIVLNDPSGWYHGVLTAKTYER